MLLKQRCTTCGESVTEANLVECDSCGKQLHAACEPFETKFDCSRCGDERWIGALEF